MRHCFTDREETITSIPPRGPVYDAFMPSFVSSRVDQIMCGRFLLHSAPEDWPIELKDSLLLGENHDERGSNAVSPVRAEFRARFNICPTQPIIAIIQSAGELTSHLQQLDWGLVPSWAKDRSVGGAKMINARAETVDEKPSFRTPFLRQRCLVPANGYYEWVTTSTGKQPMKIARPGDQLFFFAGLWDRNDRLRNPLSTNDATAKPLVTCTLITTVANSAMAAIHERMPVVIKDNHFQRWLDPGERDGRLLKELLRPSDNDYFVAEPVDRLTGE